jgi:hypothetical protein
MATRISGAPPTRRIFLTTPAGLSAQLLAVAGLVLVPAAILAALPVASTAPPREAATAEHQFALACTRTYDDSACGCAATSLRAVLGRDEFRAAVLRNAGNIFGDREHSATAHRMIDACIGVPLPPRSSE